ncbi:MAG: oligoendopeptidase F [Clostridiales bacterium]|jgi:oligoendopeptidase F|nr:oligoendopeptidase F [Clostridiales bacterium]
MSKSIIKRAAQSPAFQWKIEDLMPSDSAWQAAFDALTGDLSAFERFKGQLGASPQTLLACLKTRDGIDERMSRVYVYAFLRFYEDTGNTAYKGMSDKAATLSAKLSAAQSFIQPEILSIPGETLQRFMAEEKGLAVYTHMLDDLIRQKQYVLPPAQEEILAKSAEIARGAHDIFSMFHEADMKFGTVKNEQGEEVPLTLGNFISFMESKDRRVRADAFNALYDRVGSYKNTYAATYAASVTSDNFYAGVRNYPSALAMALEGDNIPADVYKNLIAAVHEFLPQLQRYVALRKKKLGLPELHMYDLYTPIVKEIDTTMPYDKARETVLKSLEPLGADYVATVKSGLDGGWVDVYENEGKRSGAFQWGDYGCHPFICLNYDNKINDMFTLAHEMGHAMHSHYTWGAQPYVYGDYTIFLAEVASTVNEALLMNYLLKTETDKTMREYLLNYFLEQFRGTLFRQVMFAEFEMKTHEMAANGEPLTSDALSALYFDLNKQYYGDGIVVDGKIALEWARIPHFYNAFYVYKYATGYSAAIAFSKKIQEGGDGLAHYFDFLKSGSSDYSIEILKKAGVDLSSPEPVREALKVFSGLLDEMENQ